MHSSSPLIQNHSSVFQAVFLSDDEAYYEQISFDASNKCSDAAPHTSIVRVMATQNCFISIGTAPTATSKLFLPAGIIEYFGISKGELVAVTKQGATDGVLYLAFGRP